MPPSQGPRPSAPSAVVPAARTLWGDGFAGDGLRELWAVKDWSLCSPDEYILLFPRLIPQAGEFPAVLRAHLEGCIAARAWRLSKLDRTGAGVRPRSCLPDLEDGAARHRAWFADDDAVTCPLRRAGLLHAAPGMAPGMAPDRVEAERRLLAFLDGLLVDVQAERVPAWDGDAEALLAFAAGIHPAYLWPQAAVSQARGIAAGWLGHLDRGRAALMPLVVAEYLLDAFVDGPASDRKLVALAGGRANLDHLRRAAHRRWSGRDDPIRLVPRTGSWERAFSGRGPAVAEAGA